MRRRWFARATQCEGGFHSWHNWVYAEDYKTETRFCRICGKSETRDVRL